MGRGWYLMCLIIGILKYLGQALLKWVEWVDIWFIATGKDLGMLAALYISESSVISVPPSPAPMSSSLLVWHGIQMDVLDLYCRIGLDVYWPQTVSGWGYVSRREMIKHQVVLLPPYAGNECYTLICMARRWLCPNYFAHRNPQPWDEYSQGLCLQWFQYIEKANHSVEAKLLSFQSWL